MLDDRKAAILRAVVEEYIHTAQPVGSAHVAARADLAVSSATVRNDMGALEKEGFLAQPHTSAGRVPTDKGYRFYVDTLAPSGGVLQAGQAQQVRDFFTRAHGELERMLADTSRLLSTLTHTAAVVVAPSPGEAATVRSVQLVALGGRVALAVVVSSNGAVDKCTLEVDETTGDAVLAAASAQLTRALAGRPLGSVSALAASGDAAVDAVAARALAALVPERSSAVEGGVFVGGAAHMAANFDAVETIRQVLTILEQQVVVVGLISDILDRGLTVAIGAEHGIESLATCSIVVAPYEVEGERAGSIGILGPTRMDYGHALAAVAVVSERLGRALSE